MEHKASHLPTKPEFVPPDDLTGQCNGQAIVNFVGIGGKLASPAYLPGNAANAALMLASASLIVFKISVMQTSSVKANEEAPGALDYF